MTEFFMHEGGKTMYIAFLIVFIIDFSATFILSEKT